MVRSLTFHATTVLRLLGTLTRSVRPDESELPKWGITMKNKIAGLLTTAIMFLLTAPAFGDSIVHTWTCKLHDGKSMDDMVDASSAWLKVVKSVEGGENVKLFLEFPIAANEVDGTFNFVVVADELDPMAITWSLTSDILNDTTDTWWEFAACSGSSLWQSIEIE